MDDGRTSRHVLVVVNFVTLLAGLAATASGIFSLSVGHSIGGSMAPLGSPALLLLSGLAITVVSALGMCAATLQSPAVLRAYFALLVGLLIGQLVMSTLQLARQADVDFALNDAWESAFEADHRRLEQIEKAYACCGYSSVRDRPVPSDCIDDERFGFVVSCRDRLVGPIRRALGWVGWTGLAVCGLIGLSLALYGDAIISSHPMGYERESARMSEARQLLREGNLSAHQRQP